MSRIVRAALLGAAASSSLLLVPGSAGASGGYTLGCSGSSPVPVVPNSSVVCSRAGTPSDDDGPYTFSYSPSLVCGGAGMFNVTATGPEMQIGPGSGSYTTAGGTIVATFSYFVLEKSVPPAFETHNVQLFINCATGATSGSLSE